MDEKPFYMHKKQQPRRKRTRYFRKTVSLFFCFAVLSAVAYGFLGHSGVLEAENMEG